MSRAWTTTVIFQFGVLVGIFIMVLPLTPVHYLLVVIVVGFLGSVLSHIIRSFEKP